MWLFKRGLIVFSICPMLAAQSSQSQPASLAALMDEVHQLRLAIEQSTLINARTQIAMERIRTQEARTAQAGQKLTDIRQELGHYREMRSHFSSEQKAHEDELSQTTNPEQRNKLEIRIRDLKRQLEEGSGEAELRGREGELISRMQAEQDLLTQFQSEMAQLVGSLNQTAQKIEGQRKP